MIRQLGAVLLFLLPGLGYAQTTDVTVFIDDGRTGGCVATVDPALAAVTGIDARLIATVDGASGEVVAVALSQCSGSIFDTPTALPGTPYPVGTDLGAAGADVVEIGVPVAEALPRFPGGTVSATVAASSGGSVDVLGGLSTGVAVAPLIVPTLSTFAAGLLALLLGLAAFLVLRRHRGLAMVVLAVATFAVWAANFVVDGQIGDWTGVAPVDDATGDDTLGVPNADITAAFFASENEILFFRIDVADVENVAPPPPVGPEAINDAVTTDEDTALAMIDVLGNDIPESGTTISLTNFDTTGTIGNVAINGGNLTYDPAGQFDELAAGTAGSDVFSYEITDSNGLTDTGLVTITVTGLNDAPAFTSAPATVAAQDALYSAAITTVDPDTGDTRTIVLSTGPAWLMLADAGDGTATMSGTPTNADTGANAVTLTVTDAAGATAVQSFSIDVSDINDVPTATAGGVTGNEDMAITIDLAGSDIDGDPLTFSIIQFPTNGTLGAVTSTGPASAQVVYAPNADFNGSDSLQFTVDDGVQSSAPATVTIGVAAVNDAPIADAAMATTQEDVPVTLNLGGSDVDGDLLTFSITSGPTSGSLGPISIVSNTAASVEYTPNANFNGTDSVTFSVDDGNGGTDSASVMITVGDVNDPPTAIASGATGNEDSMITIDLAGSDPDGDTLNFFITQFPTNGTLGAINPTGATTAQVVYTPNANFNGSDSLQFTVDDGALASGSATVSIGVASVNDAPTANTGTANTAEDTPVTLDLTGADVDGDLLTFAIVTGPTNGTLGAISIVSNTAASVDYTPNANFNGTDSVTFSVDDGNGGTDSASVMITVGDVNDPPTAIASGATGNEDSMITIDLAGSDPDGDTLNFFITQFPTNGTLGAINPTGATTAQVVYTPNANFNGSDSLQFTVDDGTLASGAATVSIGVASVNDAPTANTGTANTAEDTPVTLDLTGADVDGDLLTFAIVTGPTNGTLGAISIVSNTAASVDYTPNADFAGMDSVTFSVDDGNGGMASATIMITIGAVNDDPTANAQMLSANEDMTLPVNLTGSDVDGDALAFTILTPPSSGMLSAVVPVDATTATVDYTPNLNFNGADSFVFQVDDGNGGLAMATVDISVNPVQDSPTANAQMLTLNEDTSPMLLLTGMDSDGDPLGFSILTPPTNGALSAVMPIDATSAAITYTPNADFNGVDSFVFEVDDGNGNMGSATVNLTITAVNDAPSFTAGADQTVLEDAGVQSVAPWATAISPGPADEAGQLVSFIVVNDNNTLFSAQPSISATGELTFTPAPDANGSANVSVSLMDDGGMANGGVDVSPIQTFTITVTAVNDAPSFTAGADETVLEDAGAQTVNGWATAISAGPADEAAQAVSFNVTNDNNALFSAQPAVDASGNLSYTPAADASGSATVTVAAMDDGGMANGGVDTSADQTFTITVTAVNDAPSFTAGADESVLEDAGAQTVNGWATAIDDGDGGSQTLTFNVTNNTNTGLFSAGPTLDATTGNLSYTPAANANGSATLTINLSDNGGMANGGVDTSADQMFTITVTAVNDAPSFTAGADETVLEDAGAQTVLGWATMISPGPTDEAAQAVSFNVTNDNNAIFSAQPAVDASGSLTYTPAAEASGSATVTVAAMDDGGMANSGVDTSADQIFTITVTAVDDPPTAVGDMATVAEDDPATTLSVLANDTDSDGGPIAVSSVTQPVNGTVVIVGGGVTYAPDPNYCNDGAPTDDFTYMLAPGGSMATVGVTVTCVNDPPVDADESYAAQAHVGIVVNAMSGLLAGATDPEGQAVSMRDSMAADDSVGTFTTTAGGSITIAADGSFSYTPQAGDTMVADTFTYTVEDASGASNTSTVTLNVNGDLIWFVDLAASSNGNGTLASPFDALANLVGAPDPDAPGDVIFLYTGDASIATASLFAAFALEDNQQLIGEAAAASGSINDLLGFTTQTHSPSLPTLSAAARHAISSTVDGISLAMNNTVRGLDLGNTPAGFGLTGAGFGTLSLADIGFTMARTGGMLNLANGALQAPGGGAATLLSIGSNSAPGSGVNLDTITGGLTVSGATTVNGSGSAGVRIANSSTATFTFTGRVTVNNVSTSAEGIRLDDAGTASFDGGVTVSTLTGDGMTAVTGGTVTVGGMGNAIVTAQDRALTVSGTTIGAAGMTFERISADSATPTAGYGILLRNTGSQGGLTVTGDGATASSGGVIRNFAGTDNTDNGIGIRLENTSSVSLAYMELRDFQNFAIRGSTVTGFSLANSLVTATGTAFNGDSAANDEGSIRFDDLLGTATISSSTIERGFEDNLRVINDAAGTLNLTVMSSTIGLNGTLTGNDGIVVESQGTTTLNLAVIGTTFRGSRGDHIQCNALGTSTMDCMIQDNTFTNTHPNSLGSGVTISGGSAGSDITLTYDVSGTTANSQTFRDSVSSAITVNPTNGSGSVIGTIENNKIGVSGAPGSGSSGGGAGIAVGCAGTNMLVHTTRIDGNDIDRINGTNGAIDLNTQIACTLNATVTNNTVNELDNFTFAALYTVTGGSNAADTAVLCADVRGNTLDGSASFGFDVFVDQLTGSAASYRFPAFTGTTGGAALDAFLNGQNALAQTLAGIDTLSAQNVSGTACPTPP